MTKKTVLLPTLSSLLLSSLILAPQVAANDDVTILHTNDIHGRIVEERSVIGMAKLATIVEETRAEGTTLVLDAGDAFQGLPISNSTKGEDMAALMNAIQYDAMAVGNHEFDFSLDQAKKYKEMLTFPLLSANVYVNDTRLFEASTIIDKTPGQDGDEFVVIGVTTPETSTKTHPNNVVGVTFKDPITEVNQVIAEIESKATAEGKVYNRYIILAHLGIDATTPVEWQGSTLAKNLSENPALTGKTVIVIDGHSHTVESTTYGHVTYNQTGSYLNNIGKITLNQTGVTSAGIIDGKTALAKVADATIAEKVKAIQEAYAAENAVVVIESNSIELNGDRSNVRVQETNLGNVVADALLHYGQTGFAHKTHLAVTNGGGLRATIAKDQPVTKGDIIAVLPFGNIISQITVTGQQIKDMYLKALGGQLQVDKTTGEPVLDDNGQPLLEATGGFLHTAGAKVYYDTTKPADERVLHIDILDPETGAYKPLVLDQTYYLATNDFLAAGGDGYTMLSGAREEGPSMDSIFADYLKQVAAANRLSTYEKITPNSRLIAISADTDTDGDGFADYLESSQGTNPKDKDDYPGKVLPSVPTPPNSITPTPAPQPPTRPTVVLSPATPLTAQVAAQVQESVNLAAKPDDVPHLSVAYAQRFLPKTGDDSSALTVFLGLGLLAYAGLSRYKKCYRD